MAAVSGGHDGSAKNTSAKRGKPKSKKNHNHTAPLDEQRNLLTLISSAASLSHSFLSQNDLLLLPSQTLTLEALLSSASAALSPLLLLPSPPPPPTSQSSPQECWFRRFLSAAVEDGESWWRCNFRMSEQSFSILLSVLSPFLTAAVPSIPANYSLAAAIYRLAHGASYKAVGRRFGMDSAAACRAFYAVCKSVNDKLGNLFEFRSDMTRIAGGFGWISLPNCCGVLGFGRFAVAGEILGPNGALLAQALVDSEGRFLDVSAGWPSTVKPEAIFRQSRLYLGMEEFRELLNGPVHELGEGIALPQYILGESCFPLLPWLLTPYLRSNEDEEESFGELEKAFNAAHSQGMELVGTAIARVKGRWELLRREWKEECLEFLPFVVVTGCLLHNFLMKCGEPQLDENVEGLRVEELQVFDGQRDENGEKVRDALATHLSRVSLG